VDGGSGLERERLDGGDCGGDSGMRILGKHFAFLFFFST